MVFLSGLTELNWSECGSEDDDGVASVFSDESYLRCDNCGEDFGSESGGGFHPGYDTPICGECAEAMGLSDRPEWELCRWD